MEGRRLFGHLSAENNLLVSSHFRNDRAAMKADLEMVYSYFPKLRELRNRTSSYLSGGEQQMLVEEIFQTARRVSFEEKVPILLVEQNAMMALSVGFLQWVSGGVIGR